MMLSATGAEIQDVFQMNNGGRFSFRLSNALLDGQPVTLGLSPATGIAPSESAATLKFTPGADCAKPKATSTAP